MEGGLVFLGTGTGKFVTGKQLRATGGIVVQTPEFQALIDPGPGCLVRAKQFGVNLRENTVLIVTHNHLDHVNDINAVISAMTHGGFDRRGILITNETVVNGSQHYTPALSLQAKNYVERIILMEPEKRVGIETSEIVALKTQHSEEKNFGLKFFTRDFVLSYTSDTEYTNEIADQYKESDILIINCPNLREQKNNLCVEDAVKIIKRTTPKLAILTHFADEILKENPIDIAREIQRQTKIQTIAAYDGMNVTPSNYAAKLSQKTLNLYK